MKEAEYFEKDLEEFVGNPYIAALPADIDPLHYAARLLVVPPFSEECRSFSKKQRLKLLTRISNLHIPTIHDTDIAQNFERCLCWGYVRRNPMPFDVVRQALEEKGVQPDYALENYLTGYLAPAYGFPVFGISGVGKTCSVLNVAKKYDQVIHHTMFRGVSFNRTQLVWLRVECPGDGTPKGLCTAIFQAIDEVLGTQYVQEFVKSRTSKDLLILKAGSLIQTLGLGVLIIDDIQNLHGAKESVSNELLSFLINLMENIKVPVIMVGTPKILEVLQKEFQQAKRATGEGAIYMDLLKKDSKEWENLITAIWKFQYTQKVIPLSDELKDAFYDETVGNPFLVSILYKLIQDDAIISEREEFTAKDIQRVAKDKLGITAEMRKNMRDGKDEELNRYKIYWNAASVQMGAPSSTPRKSVDASRKTRQDLEIGQLRNQVLEKLTEALYEENLDDKELRNIADRAIYGNPGCKDPQELLIYAISLHNADLAGLSDEENGEDEAGLLGPDRKKDTLGYEDLKEGGLIGEDIPF